MSTRMSQLTDTTSAFGVIYRKQTKGPIGNFKFDAPSILMPRCSSQIELRTAATVFSADVYQVVFVPAGMPYSLTGATSISDAVVFVLGAQAVKASEALHETAFQALFKAQKQLVVLKRTNWVNEIMHRFVFERVNLGRKATVATVFLEAEIVKEAYYLLKERDHKFKSIFDFDTQALDQRSPSLRKAMAYVEANLFKQVTVEEIAAETAMSESTLLRTFKAFFGVGPKQYIQHRRLEEARNLLKSGVYSVGQVSDMVGYESLSSFTAAFRKKFGTSPHHILDQQG